MTENKPLVMSFRGRLDTDTPTSQATYVIIPLDAPEAFGKRGRVAVRGTINGVAYRSSIFPYAGVTFLIVNAHLRAAAGVKRGDEVDIVMARDDEPRTIETPADLAAALQANAAAQAAWDRLSYTHRREHVQAIEEAKKPETRQRRIEKAIVMLTGTE